MKSFRDLKSGDRINILEYNTEKGDIEHHISTVSILTFGTFGGGNDREVYFREEDEEEVSVSSSSPLRIRSLGGSSFRAYFTDIESMEIFIKNKINESYSEMSQESGINLREKLEQIYDKIWNSGANKEKETKSKSRKYDEFSLMDDNDFSDLDAGEILYNSNLDESFLYDGRHLLYASDGYAIESEIYDGYGMRKATQDEKKQFLSECRERILKNNGISEVLIQVLSECGYKWDINIKDIVHEN
jgi:hypothetical protein